MNEIELKPCPFCGGKPDILLDATGGATNGLYLIYLQDHSAKCGLYGFGNARYESYDGAVEHWNTRYEVKNVQT